MRHLSLGNVLVPAVRHSWGVFKWAIVTDLHEEGTCSVAFMTYASRLVEVERNIAYDPNELQEWTVLGP